VIVVRPGFKPVTMPDATLATNGSLETHVISAKPTEDDTVRLALTRTVAFVGERRNGGLRSGEHDSNTITTIANAQTFAMLTPLST
jgi:hypothetical protein